MCFSHDVASTLIRKTYSYTSDQVTYISMESSTTEIQQSGTYVATYSVLHLLKKCVLYITLAPTVSQF